MYTRGHFGAVGYRPPDPSRTLQNTQGRQRPPSLVRCSRPLQLSTYIHIYMWSRIRKITLLIDFEFNFCKKNRDLRNFWPQNDFFRDFRDFWDFADCAALRQLTRNSIRNIHGMRNFDFLKNRVSKTPMYTRGHCGAVAGGLPPRPPRTLQNTQNHSKSRFHPLTRPYQPSKQHEKSGFNPHTWR